jgi:hypothetical protein
MRRCLSLKSELRFQLFLGRLQQRLQSLHLDPSGHCLKQHMNARATDGGSTSWSARTRILCSFRHRLAASTATAPPTFAGWGRTRGGTQWR